MICKCPNCSGALKFNPAYDKMACPYCGDVFQVQEVSNEKVMSCNVYTCTSCGGELAVNGVETSTFCAYCGQPTIVFSRVSQELEPDSIIPFKITKEQAVQSIRERFAKSIFVIDEVKNFEVEKIRGIYIPYWVYDIYYYDSLTYAGRKSINGNEKYVSFVREAECDFIGITLDASSVLGGESVQCLEPYDLKELRPFQAEYLSGFYTDMYDVKEEALTDVALKKVQEMFDSRVKSTIEAEGVILTKEGPGSPKSEIKKVEYALLPVWFLTFRYQNEPYTILVNGQTGKIVGSVPFNKKKFWTVYAALTLGLGLIMAILLTVISFGQIGLVFVISMILGFVALACGGFGYMIYSSMKSFIKDTKAETVAKFVKERQDES